VTARIAYVASGCLAIAIALCPPFDALADASFAWHMVQHLVLLLVAPPLLLLGAPLSLLLSALPPRAGRAWVRIWQSPPLHLLAHPAVAWIVFVATIWISHLSPLYQASLDHEWIHILEHGLYLGAGLTFWMPVVQAGFVPQPVAFPARLFYLFLALPQGAFLAVVLLQERAPLYPHYAALLGPAAALADQRNGAAVMWIAGGLAMFAALLIVAAVWAGREHDPQLGTSVV